jgi:hypothetical protein
MVETSIQRAHTVRGQSAYVRRRGDCYRRLQYKLQARLSSSLTASLNEGDTKRHMHTGSHLIYTSCPDVF